jgi:hypothetical protein
MNPIGPHEKSTFPNDKYDTDLFNVKKEQEIHMLIHVKNYSHLAEKTDDTPALMEAIRECAKNPGSTLMFENKTYHFYRKYAYQKEYFISNNDYSLKSIIFPLIGIDGLTVEGNGAEFIMHGEILPFVVDHSKDITLRNFSVDYPRPFFSQARIITSGNGFTDLEFDQDHFPCRAENKGITFFAKDPQDMTPKSVFRALAAEFDPKTGAPDAYVSPYIVRFSRDHEPTFLDHFTQYAEVEQKSEQVIRLNGIDHHTVGSYWAATHADRENPGCLIHNSEDTLLENINFYHTAAMGVIGQISENITLRNVNTVVRPGSGRLISVSADSTHFVNCSGLVSLEDCTFTNMLDDAGNFHGTYTTVHKILGKNAFLAEFRHFQQRGVMLYHPGDLISLVENSSLQSYAILTVEEASWYSSDFIRIETKEPLPDSLLLGHAIENFSRMPSVSIKRCTAGNNRPRSFLITTNKSVRIEECTLFSMSCGLHFTGDANDWFESGPVKDVVVRNNHFRNSAYAGGAAIAITPAVKETKGNYYHSGIVIEDNVFEMHEKRIMIARNSEKIVFRRNRFVQNENFPAHPPIGEHGISIADCKDCNIEEMT